MASTEIHRLPLGNCNCYLVRQQGLVLVDTGAPDQKDRFRKMIEELSIAPRDISLIVLTHGHWDHIGSAADIKDMTGARIAINHREKDCVEQALKRLPSGIGPVGKVMALLTRLMGATVQFPGCAVDLTLDDAELSLRPFGIEGRVLHTPGHTWGSVSLLLDTGDAFVGDLAVSFLPLWFRSAMPLLGDDREAVRESWRLLLDNGASQIYPSHGNPFAAEALRKAL